MDGNNLKSAVSRYLASFGRKPDAEIVAAYMVALNQFDSDRIVAALSSPAAMCREHPASAGQLAELARTGGQDAAELAARAFDVLDRGLNASGCYPLDFADKLINATVRDLGGRKRLLGIQPEQFHTWTRKDFIAAYQRNLQQRPGEDKLRPLPPTEYVHHLLAGRGRVGEMLPIQVGRDGTRRLPPPGQKALPREDYGLNLKLIGVADGTATQPDDQAGRDADGRFGGETAPD